TVNIYGFEHQAAAAAILTNLDGKLSHAKIDPRIPWLGNRRLQFVFHRLMYQKSYTQPQVNYCCYYKICCFFGISVTVCHYPTGASKWNPTDHRLFSFISMNWAGVPLRSYDIMLNYIRSTTTRQGLKVDAILNEKKYERGIKITDKQMNQINLKKLDTLPQWNYTIAP
ncbi:MAG: hypothetical protein V3V47_06510, partial [Desulfobacteria bacterium]